MVFQLNFILKNMDKSCNLERQVFVQSSEPFSSELQFLSLNPRQQLSDLDEDDLSVKTEILKL